MSEQTTNPLWTDDDKVQSEEYVEMSLGYLRHEGAKSPDKITRHKKTILRELQFLKENFPDSYVLADGFVEFDLT